MKFIDQKVIHEYTELFKEDASKGPLTEEDFDGTCGYCGYTFTEADCLHEVLNRIACDGCYLNLGGK